MKRVLVTGSSGQLGWSIQKNSSNYPEIEFIFKNSRSLDILNIKQIENTFRTGNYDYCINCAAFTNVEQAEQTPKIAYDINAEAVKNIATICKKNEVILIHISTDYVFDGEKEEPYTIYDVPNPINEYGKSKLKGEQNIQDMLSNHYIVRTSWLYCKDYGKNFYRFVLDSVRQGKNLNIVDNQYGRPTNTYKLADYLIQIVTNGYPFGLFHYSDGAPMSWYEFAKLIVEENGLSEYVKINAIQNYRTFASRPKTSILENTLI